MASVLASVRVGGGGGDQCIHPGKKKKSSVSIQNDYGQL